MRIVFFFQAEDGIRDVAVTGVQTCALPISELAALLQVGLERWIGHQGSALFLALGLARVLPDVHYLVELPDLGRRIEHRLAAVLHLRRMTVLLVELEPGRELVVVQRVDAQIENHACSPMVSIALVASSARRARSTGSILFEIGISRLIGISPGKARSNPLRSSPPWPGNRRSERAWRMSSCMSAGRSGRASQSCI